MTLGAMIEGDKRLIAYEHRVRAQKRLVRNAEVWKHYETEWEQQAARDYSSSKNDGKRR